MTEPSRYVELTDAEVTALATHLDVTLQPAKRSPWWKTTPDPLKTAEAKLAKLATDLVHESRARPRPSPPPGGDIRPPVQVVVPAHGLIRVNTAVTPREAQAIAAEFSRQTLAARQAHRG